MKTIPTKLKIGGHTFDIIEKTLDDSSGETKFTELKIYLEKDQAQSTKESSLFHEIICHCINTTFTGEDKIAHGFMDSISEQIYQVLSDNHLLK